MFEHWIGTQHFWRSKFQVRVTSSTFRCRRRCRDLLGQTPLITMASNAWSTSELVDGLGHILTDAKNELPDDLAQLEDLLDADVFVLSIPVQFVWVIPYNYLSYSTRTNHFWHKLVVGVHRMHIYERIKYDKTKFVYPSPWNCRRWKKLLPTLRPTRMLSGAQQYMSHMFAQYTRYNYNHIATLYLKCGNYIFFVDKRIMNVWTLQGFHQHKFQIATMFPILQLWRGMLQRRQHGQHIFPTKSTNFLW